MNNKRLQKLSLGLLALPLVLIVGCKPRLFNEGKVRQSAEVAQSNDWVPKYPETGRAITRGEYVEHPLSRFTEEKMLKIKGARVAIADYVALRRDLKIPKEVTDKQIDDLLVDNFAVLSELHVRNSAAAVSTTVPLSGKSRDGIRPAKYGRAHLIPVDPEVIRTGGQVEENPKRTKSNDILFDIKGSGATNPESASKNDHGNGLMFFSEAMREYTYQKLVEEILKKESKGENWGVIPTYAVIDLNFQGKYQGNLWMPSAIILRRSHFRLGKVSNATGEPTYEELIKGDEGASQTLVENRAERVQVPGQVERILAQEKALRKYGISSASDRYPKGTKKIWRFFEIPNIDKNDPDTHTRSIVNIQVARTMEVLDFGPYNSRAKFDIPLVLGKPHDPNPYGGGKTGRTKEFWVKDIPVGDADFQQPVEKLAVDPRKWGMNPLSIGRNAFLDNMSLVYMLVGDLFQARSINQSRILSIHCMFLVDTLKQMSVDPTLHSSTVSCPQANTENLKALEEQALKDKEVIELLASDAE